MLITVWYGGWGKQILKSQWTENLWIFLVALCTIPHPSHRSHQLARCLASWTAWIWASLVAQMVKNLPAVQETGVQSLGRWDPLENGMETHSSILDWKIPWTEEPGGLQSMKSQRVRYDCAINILYVSVNVLGTCTKGRSSMGKTLFNKSKSLSVKMWVPASGDSKVISQRLPTQASICMES